LALLFPLAFAGRRLERASEVRNAELSDLALARTHGGDARAVRLNLRGLLLPFVATAAICFACALLSPMLAAARGHCSPRLIPGFAFAMQPALRELYRDPAARAQAAERHLEFFNCHPYLAAAIVGGAVRLEEEVARGLRDPRSVSAFKSALGPPFAALGDGFFWLALRPAAALVAAITEPYLGLWCVLIFL